MVNFTACFLVMKKMSFNKKQVFRLKRSKDDIDIGVIGVIGEIGNTDLTDVTDLH